MTDDPEATEEAMAAAAVLGAALARFENALDRLRQAAAKNSNERTCDDC